MSQQTITDIYEAKGGWVIRITGGRLGHLTRHNLAIARRRIPERTETPRHESGGRYTGTYLTTARVLHDEGWDCGETIHTTII